MGSPAPELVKELDAHILQLLACKPLMEAEVRELCQKAQVRAGRPSSSRATPSTADCCCATAGDICGGVKCAARSLSSDCEGGACCGDRGAHRLRLATVPPMCRCAVIYTANFKTCWSCFE